MTIYTDVLSPEGDGARSFSELVILKNLMSELKEKNHPEEPDEVVLPCNQFDMIGGRGTGGYVPNKGPECISHQTLAFLQSCLRG